MEKIAEKKSQTPSLGAAEDLAPWDSTSLLATCPMCQDILVQEREM